MMLCRARILFAVLFAMGFLIISSGCSDHSRMIGKYEGVDQDFAGNVSVIELQEGGEGLWETDVDLVYFRWKVRGDEIWLHTKTGGAIRGSLTADGFELDIPGLGFFVFVRQGM